MAGLIVNTPVMNLLISGCDPIAIPFIGASIADSALCSVALILYCILGAFRVSVEKTSQATRAGFWFSTDTRKALSIQCYTHVGVGQN